MKKKKLRLSTLLFLLLLLVGLGILLYPTIYDWYTRRQLSKEIDQYNQVAEAQKEEYTDLWNAAEEYNAFLAKKDSQFAMTSEERKHISTLLNPLGNGMLGYIDIEKIDVHLPIYQGTEETALQSGVGWWIGTSLPTGGESTHCVITAHTGLVKAKMFTDIDQLEIGDTFTLSILNRVLTYEVDQVQITEPEDLDPLLIVDGMDYVTLYTCYPYGINTERLLVRGHRIETPNTPATEQLPPQWKEMLPIILAALLLIFILILIIIIRKRKRKQKLM